MPQTANLLVDGDQWAHVHARLRANFVYVMTDGDRTKIGRSVNPKARALHIQHAEKKPIQIVKTWDFGAQTGIVEMALHRTFAPHRVWREWYAMPFADAVKTIDELWDASPAKKAAEMRRLADHGLSPHEMMRLWQASEPSGAWWREAPDVFASMEKRGLVMRGAGQLLNKGGRAHVTPAGRKLLSFIEQTAAG